jgi:hypothetical protein
MVPAKACVYADSLLSPLSVNYIPTHLDSLRSTIQFLFYQLSDYT